MRVEILMVLILCQAARDLFREGCAPGVSGPFQTSNSGRHESRGQAMDFRVLRREGFPGLRPGNPTHDGHGPTSSTYSRVRSSQSRIDSSVSRTPEWLSSWYITAASFGWTVDTQLAKGSHT